MISISKWRVWIYYFIRNYLSQSLSPGTNESPLHREFNLKLRVHRQITRQPRMAWSQGKPSKWCVQCAVPNSEPESSETLGRLIFTVYSRLVKWCFCWQIPVLWTNQLYTSRKKNLSFLLTFWPWKWTFK